MLYVSYDETGVPVVAGETAGRAGKQGLFVGSGVVEAGCRTMAGKRLKQSGMEWTVRGANSIIALLYLQLSGRTEEFREQKTAKA